MSGVAPVPQRSAEVHERAFLDTICSLCDERVLLTLAGVERLVQVLPGGPGQAIRAAEAVSGDAEIVDETCDADGAATILFLPAGTQPSGQDDLLLWLLLVCDAPMFELYRIQKEQT